MVADKRKVISVTFKLDPEDLAALEALTKRERLTRSDVIRRAIRRYAEQLKKGK